jgi:hypothetical protein
MVGETSETNAKALATIYKRDILKMPRFMEFDAGATNHGKVTKFCDKNNIKFRFAATARHRQQGIVESKCKVLAQMLYSFINNQELANYNKSKTKKNVEQSRNWYINKAHFRSVIKFINDNTTAVIPNSNKSSDKPIVTKDNILLGVGTMVRVLLDHPIVIATQKTQNIQRGSDGFGATDVRWDKKIQAITWVVLVPDQPPMYRVGNKNILYTKKQLQVITPSDRGFA